MSGTNPPPVGGNPGVDRNVPDAPGIRDFHAPVGPGRVEEVEMGGYRNGGVNPPPGGTFAAIGDPAGAVAARFAAPGTARGGE